MHPASSDRPEISQWYSSRVKQFGLSPKAVGWGRQASQYKRFEALCGLGSFGGCRLLDAGCGTAELLAFLRARDAEPVYFGLDLCEDMISGCRGRYADVSPRRFELADILEFEPNGPYEYVVASGIFGFESSEITRRLEPTLRQLFSWCTIGAAVNFLSSRAPRRSPGRLYLEPAQLLALALKLTPRVRLVHDYLPNDFTLYLYKPEPPPPKPGRLT